MAKLNPSDYSIPTSNYIGLKLGLFTGTLLLSALSFLNNINLLGFGIQQVHSLPWFIISLITINTLILLVIMLSIKKLIYFSFKCNNKFVNLTRLNFNSELLYFIEFHELLVIQQLFLTLKKPGKNSLRKK